MRRILPGFIFVAAILSLGTALAPAPAARAAGASLPAHLPAAAFVSNGADPQVVEVHVRTGPSLRAPIVAEQAVGTPVTLYARVAGEVVQGQGDTWYRVSPLKAPARFIYGHYLAAADAVVPARGKVIVVSLSQQWLVALQDGRYVLDSPVTTGRPELPTPTGTFHVLAKYTPYEFISPWPQGSPYYYPPSWTNYALEFRGDGYFIHDAPWRTAFGPGTDLPHNDPGDPLGSHGCVNVPLATARALFHWASVGTTVQIVA